MPGSIREVLFTEEQAKNIQAQLFSKRKQIVSAGMTYRNSKQSKTFRRRTTLSSSYNFQKTGYFW